MDSERSRADPTEPCFSPLMHQVVLMRVRARYSLVKQFCLFYCRLSRAFNYLMCTVTSKEGLKCYLFPKLIHPQNHFQKE